MTLIQRVKLTNSIGGYVHFVDYKDHHQKEELQHYFLLNIQNLWDVLKRIKKLKGCPPLREGGKPLSYIKQKEIKWKIKYQ